VAFFLQLNSVQLEACKEILLKFLGEYIAKLGGNNVLPFCVDIKDTCVATFLRDKAARVKLASLAPLVAVRRCALAVSCCTKLTDTDVSCFLALR
jgi:hypothetical protein